MPWYNVPVTETIEHEYRVKARSAKAARDLVDNNPGEPEDAKGERLEDGNADMVEPAYVTGPATLSDDQDSET